MGVDFNFTIEQVNEFFDSKFNNAKEYVIDVNYSEEASGLKEFILGQSVGLNEFSWFLNPYVENEVEFFRYNILYYKGIRWQISENNKTSLRIIINRIPKYKIYLENNVWQFEDENKFTQPFTIARMDELFKEFLMLCLENIKEDVNR